MIGHVKMYNLHLNFTSLAWQNSTYIQPGEHTIVLFNNSK